MQVSHKEERGDVLRCVIHVQSHFPSLFYDFRGFIPFFCRVLCLRLRGYPCVVLLQVIICRVHAFIPVLIPCCFQGCYRVCVPPTAAQEGGYASVVRVREVWATFAQPFVGESGVEQWGCFARLHRVGWGAGATYPRPSLR